MSMHQITFAPEMTQQETIVAISTPSGAGAIGIIRLSGKNALDITQHFFTKNLSEIAPNTVHFGRFKLGDTVLDEVVLSYFKGPNSYTGEDVIELSFHGSNYILTEALNAILEAGATMAEPGEFTQRAFLNGKMDLSQAEAVADLIASESNAEHRLAMHQMRGGFSAEIAKLREELIHFASLIELELDFGEEDVEFANREDLVQLIDKIRAYLKRLMESFRYGNAVKNGVPVAIIGKPNAGKSTLLNALLNDDRAIVSEIAGTTRDAIEDVAVIEGIRFRFIDTAGIRETTDTIEAIGVQKSLEKMKSAAIVLYLYDLKDDAAEHQQTLNKLMAEFDSRQTTFVAIGNKADQVAQVNLTPFESTNGSLTPIAISAKTNEGLDTLSKALVAAINSGTVTTGDVVVTNTRHLNALRLTDKALDAALNGIQSGLSGDFVASDIREALHQLGSITGQITTEDLLGNIFGKFCIGK